MDDTSESGKLCVIGAGFGRTSTNSLKLALEILYDAPCYHMKEVAPNGTKHMMYWDKMADGLVDEPNFSEVDFGTKYRCSVDFPASPHWKQQLKAFPDAKVILTDHPKGSEGWYNSCCRTIFNFQPDFPDSPFGVRVALWFGVRGRGFDRMVKKTISRNLFNYNFSKDNAISVYESWIEQVKRECPPEKLLVFKATDGWKPLCEFLEKPIPDTPYPNCNDSESFQARVRFMNRRGWQITSVGVTVVLTTLFIAFQRLKR